MVPSKNKIHNIEKTNNNKKIKIVTNELTQKKRHERS